MLSNVLCARNRVGNCPRYLLCNARLQGCQNSKDDVRNLVMRWMLACVWAQLRDSSNIS
jgi:hypothetical protein